MPLKSSAMFLLAMLLVLGFGYALVELFAMRFERGDIYPAYSTLRADPLGARALHDALLLVPEIQASRNLQPISRLGSGMGRALFIIGLAPKDLLARRSEEINSPFRGVEDFVRSGGRLILAMAPVTSSFRRPENDDPNRGEALPRPGANDARQPHAGDAGSTTTSPFAEEARRMLDGLDRNHELPEKAQARYSLARYFEFDLDFKALPEGDADDSLRRIEVTLAAELDLPQQLNWYSGLVSQPAEHSWRNIYQRDGAPVILERRFGDGSVVLMLDSAPLSNESLRDDRQPRLISWLIGPAREVIFDETHHGLEQKFGIMSLAIRYRVHYALVVLLLLAVLFIWRNATSLVPPHRGPGPAVLGVTGRDAHSGMVNLLRRHVPPRQILRRCHDAWLASEGRGRPEMKRRAEKVLAIVDAEEALPPGGQNPVAAYQAISRILADRRSQS